MRSFVLPGKVALAPMAGVSNPAYMRICSEMGATFAISELISSEAIVRGNKKTFDMLNGISGLDMMVAVQLFGNDPDTMGKAAAIIVSKYPNVMIDINMGCPVPKVALRSHAGAYLLKDLEKVRMIVTSVVNSVDTFVSVKIRSGWDNSSINAVEVARVCEEAGASLITVHPRTRAQGYTGAADWSIIHDVKNAVSIPVIGNGDVVDYKSASLMFKETGCDMVMVGRAVMGNPWLIRDIKNYLEDGSLPLEVSPTEKVNMALKHISYMLEYSDKVTTALEMRSHIAWYLKGLKGGKRIKNAIFATRDIDLVIDILNNYKEELDEV